MSQYPCTIIDWYGIPDPNENMKDRDGDALPDPLHGRLRDLAEKAITQGKAQQGIDALKPIVEPPPTAAERGRGNLSKQF